MWIVLILSLAAMSALTVIQTPREWLKHKLLRILLLIYHTVGITSIALILFAVYRTVCMSRIFRVRPPKILCKLLNKYFQSAKTARESRN